MGVAKLTLTNSTSNRVCNVLNITKVVNVLCPPQNFGLKALFHFGLEFQTSEARRPQNEEFTKKSVPKKSPKKTLNTKRNNTYMA